MALFHYIPSISQFHSFNIPLGVIDIRDVVSSLSLSISIFYFYILYIWKVSKSSYNNPEIAIEKKREVKEGR